VGFAFANGSLPGAYKADGTLKEGAVVLYVDKNTAKTVSLDVINDKNGTKVTTTGISAILTVKGRGFDRRPLSVRFIGKVGKADMDVIKDNKYFDIQGSKSLAEAKENDRGPVYYTTIEGIGDDATLYGFGINLKRTAYIEIRNLGFMLMGWRWRW
jgi:pectate lyase